MYTGRGSFSIFFGGILGAIAGVQNGLRAFWRQHKPGVDVYKRQPAALELLIKSGYDPASGARSLRHTITRRVEQCLAARLLTAEEHAFLLDATADELMLVPTAVCAAVGM